MGGRHRKSKPSQQKARRDAYHIDDSPKAFKISQDSLGRDEINQRVYGSQTEKHNSGQMDGFTHIATIYYMRAP